MMRVKLWCPVRYSPIPASLRAPLTSFLAVKTTQNADSAGWLRTLCDENTVVCALQNGVEQKAQLAPLVNGATVLPSVVWFLPSASRMPPSGCAPNRA